MSLLGNAIVMDVHRRKDDGPACHRGSSETLKMLSDGESSNKFKQNNLFVPGMGLCRASTISFNCTRFRSESIFLDIQSR